MLRTLSVRIDRKLPGTQISPIRGAFLIAVTMLILTVIIYLFANSDFLRRETQLVRHY